MSTTSVPMKNENRVQIQLVVAILLAIAGIGAWIYQLNQGLQITGLGEQIIWGLYIAAFFTAIGAGATMLVLTGVSEFTTLLDESAKKRSLLLALASFVAGGMLIAIDLGNPFQTWRILTAFRFSSMMTWDFWLLLLSMLVAVVYLLMFQSGGTRKALGVLGIVTGVAVVVIEAWMLSQLAAHPMWTTGLTVVTFLVGAAIAGLSIALIAGIAPEQTRNLLRIFLVVSLVLVAIEILTTLVGGEDGVGVILAGFAAPAFWWQVILGLVAAFVLLTREKLHWLAGLLALSGVVAEKVWLLGAGQANPWLDLPAGVYTPNWFEIVAVVGMAGLGYLVYLLLILILKPE